MSETEGQATFAAYNVTGSFPDSDDARRALEALEGAGVPASDLSLLGSEGDAAADVRDTDPVDEAVITRGLRSTLGGAAAGSAVGALVGFLVGAAVFGVPGFGPVVDTALWATTIGGLAAGGGLGFTTGAIIEMKQGQAWELTLNDVGQGDFVVGAHTDTWEDFCRARDALASRNPTRMREFDREGNEVAHPAE